MFNINKRLSFLLVLFLVSFFAAKLALAETVKEYVDDATITAKISMQLAATADVPSKDILVNTYKGKVQLCGFVNKKDQADAAEQIVSSVKGVDNIHNNLIPEERNNDSNYSSALNDTKITADVKQILFRNNKIPSNQISVVTKNGVVQLCGFVEDQKVVDQASEALKSVKSIRLVKNNLIPKA